jgi:hypothetical protein
MAQRTYSQKNIKNNTNATSNINTEDSQNIDLIKQNIGLITEKFTLTHTILNNMRLETTLLEKTLDKKIEKEINKSNKKMEKKMNIIIEKLNELIEYANYSGNKGGEEESDYEDESEYEDESDTCSNSSSDIEDKKENKKKKNKDKEEYEDADDNNMEGIVVKLNKKSNSSFNPFELFMNFAQSVKKKEDEKEEDSEEDYDETFKIKDDDDVIKMEKNYINMNNELVNLDSIISLGEKFQPLLKNGNYIEDYESDDEVFDVFNIKKQTRSKNQNLFCSFFKFEDKKYNVNLKKISDLVGPLKKLKRMVGLKNVKEQIFETIIYYLQGFENKNKNMMHSVIEGPPGVGKTKLGKILAQIYCAMGIIPSSKFKYVKATDMIGEHVGATKHMTQEVIDEADGGVLFIDEAYALSTGDSKDPYGKECMDTLNFNLSENKKKLIVIIAGYPEQLEKNFFSHNPGLQRRFPFRYKIDKYDAKELTEIFKEKLKLNKWKINNNITQKHLEDFFGKNIEDFENFGGDIENFFKKCQFSHSRRTIGLHPGLRGKLSIDDLNNGLVNFKKNKKDNDVNKKIWQHMYV